jgi:hypothetical protein
MSLNSQRQLYNQVCKNINGDKFFNLSLSTFLDELEFDFTHSLGLY